MLKRSAIIAAAVVAVLLGGTARVWAADPPISCPPGTEPSPRTGECIIIVTPPDGPGDPDDPGDGGDEPVVVQKCINSLITPAAEVPCSSDAGWWSNSQNAYCKARVPQPPFSDPAWEGHTNGQIYECLRPVGVGPVSGVVFWVWLATPPGGAPPDPRVLAQQAIARMNLRAINIGIVPEPQAGSIGLIGMPTWMWAQNPGATTWGPQTESASAGGFTVTATAKAQRTVWTMGDGSTVTCTGPGTPYAASYGKQSSPTCGHTYTRQGTYTVRATTYWVVTWAGIGQTGTIPLNFTDTTTITMGEAQVLSN
ncbi:hypothetical protein [Knoellia sp. LjRoot47]|uniref:hypothetical protein n=1 Tax=Knoellia sp. LjRoot47 TaxID=3342330 RepID=UPI003ECD289A